MYVCRYIRLVRNDESRMDASPQRQQHHKAPLVPTRLVLYAHFIIGTSEKERT